MGPPYCAKLGAAEQSVNPVQTANRKERMGRMTGPDKKTRGKGPALLVRVITAYPRRRNEALGVRRPLRGARRRRSVTARLDAALALTDQTRWRLTYLVRRPTAPSRRNVWRCVRQGKRWTVKTLAWGAAGAFAALLGAVASPAHAAVACEGLTGLHLPHVTIAEAKVIDAAPPGVATSPARPSY